MSTYRHGSSPSRERTVPRLGSTASAQDSNQASDHQAMLAKLQRSLDELRSRYSAERKELLAASSEHVADARSEMDQIKQVATRCIQRVDAFRRQLRALESSAHSAAGGDGAIRASLSQGSERLAHALDNLREATEQTQLLQSAILNDRVRREARMRQARDEDAELELRLRHLEESNAMMRAELAAVKAVNAEAFKSIDKVLEICRPDATSAIHGSELKQVHNLALRDVSDVREQLTVLRGRVESIETFSKSEDHRRNSMLQQLEQVVKDIETRPPPPSFTPKIQTKMLEDRLFGGGAGEAASGGGGGGGGSGTYPSVAPRYGTSSSSSSDPSSHHHRHHYGDNNDTATSAADTIGTDDTVAARRKAAAQLRDKYGHGPAAPQGSAFVAAPGSPQGKLPSLKNRLMAFYSKYNPEKLSDVDGIMAEYAGAEEELFSSLEVHYDAFGYFSNDLTLPS